MKKSQIGLLAIAVVVIAMIAVFASSKGSDKAGNPTGQAEASNGTAGSKPANGDVAISIVYSPEKEELMEEVVKNYNATQSQVDGQRVIVKGEMMSSGDSQAKIAKGTLTPTMWSPGSSLWGRLLNFEADKQLAPDISPSIVRTPMVIAMWEPMAKALGYPKKKIGFSDILKLSKSNQGWAAYGHPEFGAFKLVHTNPDFSTAGLSSVVAEYYSTTGKTEGLQIADVNKARKEVKAIEHSIVHYGDTAPFIAEQMKLGGPGYASAAFLEESLVAQFNIERGSQQKLVAIYPKEGTFYLDHPAITLAGAWVTPAQKKAAENFTQYMTKNISSEQAAKYGNRPSDVKAKVSAPLTAENGIDPSQPKRVLGLPEPRVLDAIRTSWRLDRKAANVLLVFDTSGSMNDEDRLKNAKKGLQEFLNQVAPQDRVGLNIFSDRQQPVLPIEAISASRSKLKTKVNNLIADGGTSIYDATLAGVDQVNALQDKERINAVVLLTDGEDTDSQNSIESVVAKLKAQGDSATKVRVFTIAYGSGAQASLDNLKAIADASGGKSYEGTTENIESVYRSISSFF